MKILFVNRMASMVRGGGETFDLEISRYLQKIGCEVLFLSGIPVFGDALIPVTHAPSFTLRTPYTGKFRWDQVRGGWRLRWADFWLFETGAGSALITGAFLGLIVGLVIVAQTLYASTKDHLNEFATLRALGASAGYIHRVILIQAVLSAVLGYGLGLALSLCVVWASQFTSLFIIMTPELAVTLFVLTVGMCIFAALGSIFKVTRIDPAGVFSR